MGGAGVDRGRRRFGGLLFAAVAVALIAALGVGGVLAYQDGRLNTLICDGDCGPEAVVPPGGLTDASVALPSRDDPVGGEPDLAAALRAGRAALGDDLLGPRTGLAVAAVDPESPISSTTDAAFVPASTTKLLTGLAALLTLDPQQRFSTGVVRDGTTDRIVLRGGGDPYLTDRAPDRPDVRRATLADLAASTATALQRDGLTSVDLRYDDTLFEGDSDNAAWETSYVAENVVTPISPLWVDRGVDDNGLHSRTPARDAAVTFARLLEGEGITVDTGSLGPLSVPGDPLATVQSATVSQIVESLVRTSDNETAEVVARQVALESGEPATFEGGAKAVLDALSTGGIEVGETTIFDGSGLSRRNRIAPATLVDVVRLAYASGRTAPVVDDLPVSGFSGTLADRYDRARAGLVRAKTGTLSGVHSLAGVVLDGSGRPIVFAVMTDDADRANPFAAQARLDDVVEAIAASG